MNKELSYIPITDCLPHRKPMLLLDKILSIHDKDMGTGFCEATFDVDAHCLFVQEDGTLEPVALMEIMAQCFAAGNGLTRPKRFGYLASMRSMKVFGTAHVGDTLRAQVRLIAMMQGIMVVEGALFRDDICLLTGQYKIFVPDFEA